MSALFDGRELLERADRDWDFLAETIQMLAADGRTLLAEMRRAEAAQDAPAIHRAAHTMKGMISNFCSPTTSAAAVEVERLGREGDFRTAAAAIGNLESRLNDLVAELNAFLTTRPQCAS